jgi:hypothetical protein
MWKQNKDKGLLIVAVSDEPAATLQSFIKKENVTYPIVSAKAAFKNYGITKRPTEFAIDAKGLISDSNVIALLKDCDVPPSADYSKKFDVARAAIKKGDFKKAADELAKLEKDTGKDGDNATALSKWVEEHGARRITEADGLLAAGDVITARDIYNEVQKSWSSKSDNVKSAKDKLAELQKDKDAKKALSQEKAWYQAGAAEDANDKQTAAALYMKCAKGAAGTKFAELCEKKAKDLK